MDIKAIAIETRLSVKMLKYFQRENIIDELMTSEQKYFLVHIAKIYAKPEFIRLQVARYNPTKRARLVFGADLNPIEACILSRWLGHYADKGYNLSVELVVAEVMAFKKLPESKKAYVTETAYKMRQKARNLVYRNGTGALIEKATALTDPQKARLKKLEKARKSKQSASSNFRQNDIFGY